MVLGRYLDPQSFLFKDARAWNQSPSTAVCGPSGKWVSTRSADSALTRRAPVPMSYTRRLATS